MHRRFWLSVVILAVGTSLLVAAGLAAPAQSSPQAEAQKPKRGGTLKIVRTSDFDHLDPGLSYFSHVWTMQHATQLKLMNFPDTGNESATRPTEIIRSYSVSKNGRTYTFNLKRGFRFSNGNLVTAANFARAINRNLSPKLNSPAGSMITD